MSKCNRTYQIYIMNKIFEYCKINNEKNIEVEMNKVENINNSDFCNLNIIFLYKITNKDKCQ